MDILTVKFLIRDSDVIDDIRVLFSIEVGGCINVKKLQEITT